MQASLIPVITTRIRLTIIGLCDNIVFDTLANRTESCIDYISAQEQIDINLEEISFDELPSKFKNKTITEIGIRQLTGANIIGLKGSDGEFVINPKPTTIITSKIKMFVLGTPDQIKKLKELFHV